MEEERKIRFEEPGGDEVIALAQRPEAPKRRVSLIEFLLTHGIVKTKKQAEQVLIVATAGVIMLTIWIWSVGDTSSNGIDTSDVDDPRDAIQI